MTKILTRHPTTKTTTSDTPLAAPIELKRRGAVSVNMDMQRDTPPWRIFPKQIEAACFNRVRLALLRLENPLRIALAQHCGLEVILYNDSWFCVDSFAHDQLILAWREFQIHPRDNLHQPIACEIWLYHHCAGLIMGASLDDLHHVVEYRLGHTDEK